jgi:hypothetical protein
LFSKKLIYHSKVQNQIRYFIEQALCVSRYCEGIIIYNGDEVGWGVRIYMVFYGKCRRANSASSSAHLSVGKFHVGSGPHFPVQRP